MKRKVDGRGWQAGGPSAPNAPHLGITVGFPAALIDRLGLASTLCTLHTRRNAQKNRKQYRPGSCFISVDSWQQCFDFELNFVSS